jgi:DNA polymerase-1
MSRADAVGFFWSETPKQRAVAKKNSTNWGLMPVVPDNSWRPPEFPNLSAAKVIGLDTETWDPELTEAGPGWGRGKGHIIGVSLAVEDGTSWYFPMRHGMEPDHNGSLKQTLPPEHAAMNLNPDVVLRWLKTVLEDNRPKVGANLLYDMGWLKWEGVNPGGRMYDVQYAEALLDSETPGVALDQLAKKYLKTGKETEELYEWLSRWNGKPANHHQRKWLFKTPPCLAGPYAEADAALPIKIMEHQWPAMAQRGVTDLFDLETRLTPLMVDMRLKGAPVNVAKAESVYDQFGSRLLQMKAEMHGTVGFEINPNSTDDLKKAFNSMGIPLPEKMDKDKGEMVVSFDKPRLESIEHPFALDILNYRKLDKVRGTFMKSYIIDKHVNGRVYCSFHPLKGSENGTRSGRLASSDPNLQNIPVRTEEGKLVRECFDGTIHGLRWRSFDYSSIEYRLLVHFAVGPGADDVRAQFAANPDTDYHQFVMDLIHHMTGILLERGKTKTINFGIIYGMALNALAIALGLPKPEAKNLLDTYHEAIPYARSTMDECANEVHRTGMVRTILNRASDFSSWGPKGWTDEGRVSMSYEAACRKYGMYNIERQKTHKALNRKLQGSAADVMKKAMVDAYEAGLFAEHACGIPVLTVHDELDFEDKGDLDNPAWDELKHVMENCMGNLLRVPLLVDGDVGPTWRDAH